ncbi:uncharacterized, partial [Tachysurus ichikawai]
METTQKTTYRKLHSGFKVADRVGSWELVVLGAGSWSCWELGAGRVGSWELVVLGAG